MTETICKVSNFDRDFSDQFIITLILPIAYIFPPRFAQCFESIPIYSMVLFVFKALPLLFPLANIKLLCKPFHACCP